MAQLAIWLLVALVVLTLGVRIAIQLRRTGRTGLIGLREGAGAADWGSGILFVGGMAMGASSPILVLNERLEPIDALDVGATHVVGILLAAAGGLAVFAAQLGMGESWRIGVRDEERTDLVTRGWFAVCRNPIYTSMIVGWLGLALIVPTWLGFAAVAVIAVGLEIQVRFVEEPYLMRTHGDEYRGYASRVGRFLPGVGRFG
ncbi:MAG TPA: isoprenylcysteine carboxylmethyltransferase family protein [Solirubrobacterales bacterium]